MSSHLHYLLFSFTFFCDIFSETILFMSFFQCLFSQCGKHLWKHGTQQFFLSKNETLCLCSLLLKPLLWILFFLIVQKTKQISIRLFFLPNVVKINSCVKYSPSQHFHHKKNLTKTKFLPFGRIFLFFFLFSSTQEKHFFEQTSVLLVLSLCISLSLKKNLPYFENDFLSIFFDFLSYKFLFRPFFITFCFCSSRFAFTSFFISFFVWSFYFLDLLLLELIFLYLHFLWFFWTTSSLSFCIKNSSTFHFLRAFVTSLCPPFVHPFVHLLSLFSLLVLSVYDFFLKHVFDTSAFSKAFYLFVGHLHKFVCFCMFVFSLCLFFSFFCILLFFWDILLLCSLSWTFVFPMFFVVLFECIFFFEDTLWFDYTFFCFFRKENYPFTYSPFISKTTFFF